VKPLKIVIPSRGRADVNLQTTLMFLAEAKLDVTIVVPANHHSAYVKELVQHYSDIKLGVVARPDTVTNLAQSLEWIIHEWSSATENLLILDDDLRFARRVSEDFSVTGLRQSKPSDFPDLLQVINELLVEYPMVGISARGGNQTRKSKREYATRQMQAHAIDVAYFRQQWIHPSAVICKSDFHMTLSVLESGVQNALICDFTVDQYRGTNADGGVSFYRTEDMMDEAAHRLKYLHPDYVEVVRKTVKWKGMEKHPLDVRIAWKRAYREAIL
jgi:hypothetical protein